MEVRTSDAETLMRAVHLLGALDRSRFTKEQLEVVDSAVDCVDRLKKSMQATREYKARYVAEKRKKDKAYAMSYDQKAAVGKPKGRPRKKKEDEPAE